MIKRRLILEDGSVFEGDGFGSIVETSGEVIVNTAMTGYQEMMTNSSYYGQLLVMANPSIGHSGINREDFEAIYPSVNGLIVKELCHQPVHFRSDETLEDYLKTNHIPGILGIDTRMLTRHLKKKGTLKGMMAGGATSVEEVQKQLANRPLSKNRVKQVSTKQAYHIPGRGVRIIVIDLGMKNSMIRELTERNCQLMVVPYWYDADKILRIKPNGVIITNGPGNPEELPEIVATIQRLKGIPLFGIGLGHQLMALAFGAGIDKMKVGHHGNIPVKELSSQKSYMTTQNHQYTVCASSINDSDLIITHLSLNDQNVEGLKHIKYLAFSVQFYPEGGPGPSDTSYLYDHFINQIKENERGGIIDA